MANFQSKEWLKAAMEDKSVSIPKIHKLETLISRIDIDIDFNDMNLLKIFSIKYANLDSNFFEF
ncbi:MAG: hypothetical protein U9N52_07060 [Campylobacterota bacterium]|nr:hypothetical protein [Campylobacterota bacterium]